MIKWKTMCATQADILKVEEILKENPFCIVSYAENCNTYCYVLETKHNKIFATRITKNKRLSDPMECRLSVQSQEYCNKYGYKITIIYESIQKSIIKE